MLIVIEGCDGAGKSTLADELEALATLEGYEVTRLHKGPPVRPAILEYTEDLGYEPELKPRRLVVCDRWHVGEMIYGPIYRGVSQLTADNCDMVESLLDRLGALKVFLDTPNEVLRDRAFGTRGETFLQEHDLEDVANRYRHYFNEHLVGWRTVFTNVANPDLARRLLTRALTREIAAASVVDADA